MEYGFGACSVLQREKNSLEYVERWIPVSAHPASHQQGATPLEVDAYLAGNGIEFLDLPEPIDTHSADEWENLCAMDDGDPHYIPEHELNELVA